MRLLSAIMFLTLFAVAPAADAAPAMVLRPRQKPRQIASGMQLLTEGASDVPGRYGALKKRSIGPRLACAGFEISSQISGFEERTS